MPGLTHPVYGQGLWSSIAERFSLGIKILPVSSINFLHQFPHLDGLCYPTFHVQFLNKGLAATSFPLGNSVTKSEFWRCSCPLLAALPHAGITVPAGICTVRNHISSNQAHPDSLLLYHCMLGRHYQNRSSGAALLCDFIGSGQSIWSLHVP